jgi:hypothetical protein
VAPEPGIAAPPAPMPISETTTSWLVVMSQERTSKPGWPARATYDGSNGKLRRDGAQVAACACVRACVRDREVKVGGGEVG